MPVSNTDANRKCYISMSHPTHPNARLYLIYNPQMPSKKVTKSKIPKTAITSAPLLANIDTRGQNDDK